MPDTAQADETATLLTENELPPGGAATAEPEKDDAPEPSDTAGFNGKGSKQAEASKLRDRRLANAEQFARNGILPPRGPDGKFQLDDPPSAPGEAKPEPKATEKPKDEPAAEPPVDEAQMRRARRALLRDGYEPEDLADWKPEKVLTLGLKRATFQDKTDKRMNELREKAGETIEPGREDPEPEPESQPDESAALATLLFGGTAPQGGEGPTNDLSDVLDALNDEEKAKVEKFTSDHRSAVDRYSKGLTRAQETAAKAVGRAVSLSLRAAQNDLAGKYPFLREPERWNAVLRELSSLDERREVIFTEDQSRVNKLVEKAVFAAYGPEIVSQARTRQADTSRRERDSVPYEGAAPTKQNKISKDTFMRLAQKAAEKHPGDDAAAKAYLDELVKKA